MSLHAHLNELASKHKALETELADMLAHPASSTLKLPSSSARSCESRMRSPSSRSMTHTH